METSPSEADAPLAPEMVAIAVAIAMTWPSPVPARQPRAPVTRWRWAGHQAGYGVQATQAGYAWS